MLSNPEAKVLRLFPFAAFHLRVFVRSLRTSLIQNPNQSLKRIPTLERATTNAFNLTPFSAGKCVLSMAGTEIYAAALFSKMKDSRRMHDAIFILFVIKFRRSVNVATGSGPFL